VPRWHLPQIASPAAMALRHIICAWETNIHNIYSIFLKNHHGQNHHMYSIVYILCINVHTLSIWYIRCSITHVIMCIYIYVYIMKIYHFSASEACQTSHSVRPDVVVGCSSEVIPNQNIWSYVYIFYLCLDWFAKFHGWPLPLRLSPPLAIKVPVCPGLCFRMSKLTNAEFIQFKHDFGKFKVIKAMQ
jgi:hypothetical protein